MSSRPKTLTLLSYAVLPAIAFAQSPRDKRPNILFILSDDHSREAISAYGGINAELAPTPNIDAIAKDGALFRNMMVTNSISGPSRAAILTGKYSTTNGFYQNEGGIRFDSTQMQSQKLLQASGYSTSLFGKWHRVQPHYGVRTERYKLIHYYYDIDTWELFDLESDPNELTNLYNNADYAEVVAELT